MSSKIVYIYIYFKILICIILGDAQNQLALMYEKERAATEKYIEYQSKMTAYETQTNALRQEKLQLSSEIESLKAQLILLEESKSRYCKLYIFITL